MRIKNLALAVTLAALSACSADDKLDGEGAPGVPLPAGPTYVTVSQVDTPEGATTLLAFTPTVPNGEMDFAGALEIPGYAEVAVHEGHLYVGDSESFTITRYDVDGDRLVRGTSLGLQGRGLSFVNELFFVSSTKAFVVNPDQYRIIEWNPSTMEIVTEHDISALAREGWGNEYRGGHLRERDGALFFIWAYTNDRKTFVNDFIVGVFDTKSGAFQVLVDRECPASAGFGGFFDEAGDLYLPADSFGGFTYLGSDSPKDACVRRVRAGERSFDPTYLMKPTQALGSGLAPWGLYYAGHGTAYTTAVDPARLPSYASVYELIFDTVHEGYAVDLAAGTSKKLEEMPPDAVGFESVTIDGQLLVPRSAGSVRIYEIDNVRTRVYALDGKSKVATPRFTMPGYLGLVARLR